MTAAHRLPQLRSRAAFVPQLLDLFPVEGRASGIVPRQLSSPFAQPLERCPRFILISAASIGHEPGYGLAMPRDNDLLAVFYSVKQTPTRVLSLKIADFTNTGIGHSS